MNGQSSTTSTAEQTLAALLERGVQLWVEGDDVRFRAPRGALTDELRQAFRGQREEIADLLGKRFKHAPCSFGQQRLWLVDQLQPGSAAYNMADSLRLRGRLDRAAMAAAWDLIVARHESLRTSFRALAGRPFQVIEQCSGNRSELPLVDLAHLASSDRHGESRRLALSEARRPFDLGRGPLVRRTLLQVANGDGDGEEHLLLLTLHHAISDGRSHEVLQSELQTYYEHFSGRNGKHLTTSDLPWQYADFAVWQRRRSDAQAIAEQLTYWREKLAGLPTLELPTDHPRPKGQSGRGSMAFFALGAAASSGLEALRARHKASLFMTVGAVFAALLHRWTGEHDLVVGSPVANRHRRELQGLIGFFVNNLVLRVDVADQGFDGVLERVRETLLQAYAHQDIPFDKLVEELQPERDPDRHPLFQLTFALHNRPLIAATDEPKPGLTLEPAGLSETQTARFDLELNLWHEENALHGCFVYNADLFDSATIRRLGKHLVALTSSGVEEPQKSLQLLPWLTAGERQQLTREWNDTVAAARTADGASPGLYDRFLARAEAQPDAIALQFDATLVTYGQLRDMAYAVARRLRQQGVDQETPVALFAERSPEWVAAVLGIVAAGGTYVPLDPTHPPQRLQGMLEDAGATRVLTSRPVAETPVGANPTSLRDVVRVDSKEVLLRSASSPGEQLAYLMFTSGSTGAPKGIGISQRAILRLVLGTNYIQLDSSDRVAHLSNTSFDASTFELWGALLSGGCLVGLSNEAVLDPHRLAKTLSEQRISAMFLTTALFNQVVAAQPKAFAHVGNVLFGGEAVDVRRVREALAGEPPSRLLHVYGPTESTTFATWQRLRHVADTDATVPIGIPLTNTAAVVLDRCFDPTPIGALGELAVGGAGLARGYHGRPAGSARSFVPHPFAPTPGERLYRTGDLVRQNVRGELVFVGRSDHQLKIRGFRIEPAEIEKVLSGVAGVHDATVLAREAGGASVVSPRLVAYIVAGPGHAPLSAHRLQADLSGQLPTYMIPKVFVELDELPVTAGGKIDRAALEELPLPDDTRSALASSYVAPRTPKEEILAGIWSEVLGVGQVGVEDDFFELGGHSLLATQVVSRIRQTFDSELPVRALFEQPTISGLAVELDRTAKLLAPPLVPVARDQHLPLSFAQQRLWFLHQLEPEASPYHMPSSFRLSGKLDAAALQAALRTLVERHEALRTRFPSHGGRARQIIEPTPANVLPVVDLSAVDGELEIRRWSEREAIRPFDLVRGPLLRLSLWHLDDGHLEDGEHVLLLNLHHIISDGWSHGVLFGELSQLYAAAAARRDCPLPHLPIQYADFALWQRNWLGPIGAEGASPIEAQAGFWREKLADLTSTRLPSDRTPPTTPSYRGANRFIELSAATTQGLRALSRASGATLFMTLMAGFMALMGRLSGQADVVLGSPIANRNRRELEGLIGFFVNTLVFRGDLTRAASFRELVEQVRDTALEAYAHQDFPFEQLVEMLQPERDLSRHPLFQVAFMLQNAPSSELELSGLHLRSLDASLQRTRYDLEVHLWEVGDTLGGFMSYSTDLFDVTTMGRLWDQYETLLSEAVGGTDRPLAELSILSSATPTPASRGVERHSDLRPTTNAARAPGGPCEPGSGGAGLRRCPLELFVSCCSRSTPSPPASSVGVPDRNDGSPCCSIALRKWSRHCSAFCGPGPLMCPSIRSIPASDSSSCSMTAAPSFW